MEIEAAGGYKAYVSSSGNLNNCWKQRLVIAENEVANRTKVINRHECVCRFEESDLIRTDGFKVEGRLAEPFEKHKISFSRTTTKNSVINIWRIKRF